MRLGRRRLGGSALGLAATLLLPASARAQEGGGTRWFPRERLFEAPIAAPLEPRFAAGLIATSLFEADGAIPRERPPFSIGEPEEDARLDLQAAVSVGTTIPIVEWGAAGTRYGVAFQVLATERFRMERPSRDALGGDWIAALPLSLVRADGFSARLRLLHRSAHLGDEFAEEADARRVEFSHEAVDLIVSHRLAPALRVYGGGAWVVRSQTYVYDGGDAAYTPGAPSADAFWIVEADDRYGLQTGVEVVPVEGEGAIQPVLAVEWQRLNHEGSAQVNAAAGLQGVHHGRTARLLLQCHTGASPMGEFFLSEERYCGAVFTLEI